MKRIILTFATIAAMSLGAGFRTSAAIKGWEYGKMDLRETRQVLKNSDIEIRTAPALIIVTTAQPVRIKVFTILGRLVSDETLKPGTSRLNMESSGVYIVKVGELTCKVAI
ncbi:MAG: T9SS type A sorting domain-containing protein [Muribaculaceae bacterium]|nr:T9SS type A sorting domain-containing protein [Muribaculaceae bacterium]